MSHNLNTIRARQRTITFAMFVSLFILLSMATIASGVAQCEDPSAREHAPEFNVADTIATEVIEVNVKLISEPVLFSDIQYIAPITEDDITSQIGNLDPSIAKLEIECNNDSYTDGAIESMRAEIDRLTEIKEQLNSDAAKIKRWKDEHYYAAVTWMYLRSHGYSEAVVSGILGNMMAEVSGGSLDLQPNRYSSGRHYYGLCQWSLHYRPHVAGMSFEDQLDYLVDGIEKEINTYGYAYKRGFGFDDFMALKDPEDVALAFAKVYERCGSGSYGLRQKYAMKAYNYFTGE